MVGRGDRPAVHRHRRARFATEAEAEAFEVTRAREWIEQNAPSNARVSL